MHKNQSPGHICERICFKDSILNDCLIRVFINFCSEDMIVGGRFCNVNHTPETRGVCEQIGACISILLFLKPSSTHPVWLPNTSQNPGRGWRAADDSPLYCDRGLTIAVALNVGEMLFPITARKSLGALTTGDGVQYWQQTQHLQCPEHNMRLGGKHIVSLVAVRPRQDLATFSMCLRHKDSLGGSRVQN